MFSTVFYNYTLIERDAIVENGVKLQINQYGRESVNIYRNKVNMFVTASLFKKILTVSDQRVF